MKPKVLVVDDDEDIRAQLKWGLLADYEVLLADDRPSALTVFKQAQPSVVLLDLGLPPRPADPTEGLRLAAELLERDPCLKVIVITGQSERDVALQAIANGAHDLLPKPVSSDELRIIVHRAAQMAQLEKEYIEAQQPTSLDELEGILGSSDPVQHLFSLVRKVAKTDAPVLVLGESGTGKEMVAQAIHRGSPRKSGPFVAINCGAIPEALLESELFGHERGAFTGAHARRQGHIEGADRGTLFLDEIGELSVALQVKLLRFLQERTFVRVGGREQLRVDARVIAATNKDLQKALQAQTFREDLYYRLAVVVIGVPPLRARANDVLLLAEHFVKKAASAAGRTPPRFTRPALRALARHPWPGNVRQLENCIRRAVIMANGRQITEADLDLGLTPEVVPEPAFRLKEARERVERDLVQRALQFHAGNISSAAEDLGISRPTLYELMERFGLREGKEV